MPEVKVTDDFQVAIPRVVREAFGLKPGEVVWVECSGGREIVIKRRSRITEPMIGRMTEEWVIGHGGLVNYNR
jgi:AbrB family looped-hinge helix DNA binding protein